MPPPGLAAGEIQKRAVGTERGCHFNSFEGASEVTFRPGLHRHVKFVCPTASVTPCHCPGTSEFAPSESRFGRGQFRLLHSSLPVHRQSGLATTLRGNRETGGATDAQPPSEDRQHGSHDNPVQPPLLAAIQMIPDSTRHGIRLRSLPLAPAPGPQRRESEDRIGAIPSAYEGDVQRDH
jgi:hypothetical protein